MAMTNPITITLPRNELSALLGAARIKRARIQDSTSPGARQLDRVISRVENALILATEVM